MIISSIDNKNVHLSRLKHSHSVIMYDVSSLIRRILAAPTSLPPLAKPSFLVLMLLVPLSREVKICVKVSSSINFDVLFLVSQFVLSISKLVVSKYKSIIYVTYNIMLYFF